jgi:hypothetical protein
MPSSEQTCQSTVAGPVATGRAPGFSSPGSKYNSLRMLRSYCPFLGACALLQFPSDFHRKVRHCSLPPHTSRDIQGQVFRRYCGECRSCPTLRGFRRVGFHEPQPLGFLIFRSPLSAPVLATNCPNNALVPDDNERPRDACPRAPAELCSVGQPLRLRSGQATGGCPHASVADANKNPHPSANTALGWGTGLLIPRLARKSGSRTWATSDFVPAKS